MTVRLTDHGATAELRADPTLAFVSHRSVDRTLAGRQTGSDRPAETTATRRNRAFMIVATLVMALPLLALFVAAVPPVSFWAGVAGVLFAVNGTWVAASAATALTGLAARHRAARGHAARHVAARLRPPAGWAPRSRTAILVLICGEPPAPVAASVAALAGDLRRAGLDTACDIHILSDTSGPARIRAERAVFDPLVALGTVRYRCRRDNAGRKPGNIADWLAGHRRDHDFVLVLDADSRMTGRRIAAMIRRMERVPDIGLIQTGMRLLPSQSRFGRLQRLSARLCGPVFVAGLSAWSGTAGNYWGHNALLRVAAFAPVARLPRLSGRPPFGGDILSHDFVEAAWLRRAGWRVEIDPDTRGSFEDGPQTLAAFHRRDRRWCQGNLQHIRLMSRAGLHPVSRLHLVAGVQSYLASPFWLALVVLFVAGVVPAAGLLPLAGALGLLMVPKICSLAARARALRGRWRRRVMGRAALAELVLSTLVSPLIMVRQTLCVAAVLAGRDCGWKRPGGGTAGWSDRSDGAVEAVAGVALGLAALLYAPDTVAALWLAPILLPLLCAPLLVRWLDGSRPA